MITKDPYQAEIASANYKKYKSKEYPKFSPFVVWIVNCISNNFKILIKHILQH